MIFLVQLFSLQCLILPLPLEWLLRMIWDSTYLNNVNPVCNQRADLSAWVCCGFPPMVTFPKPCILGVWDLSYRQAQDPPPPRNDFNGLPISIIHKTFSCCRYSLTLLPNAHQSNHYYSLTLEYELQFRTSKCWCFPNVLPIQGLHHPYRKCN